MKNTVHQIYHYLDKLKKVYPDMTVMEIVYRAYKYCHPTLKDEMPGIRLRNITDSEIARALEKFYKKDGATD